MSAPSSSTRKASGAGARWGLRVLVALLAVLGIAAVGTWMTLSFGSVYGVELNPETFQRRSFLYYEIPGLGWQVRKVERIDSTGKTEEFLQTNNHIPKKSKGEAVWHIVQAHRGSRSWDGDARILVNYFDAKDSYSNPVWLEWSSANPKLAGLLWPAVSQLAMDELYIYVPEVLTFAESAKDARDAKTFSTELNSRLGQAYHTAALRCQEAGNHEAAVEYLDQAVKLDPSNADYRQAQAKSREALGKAKPATTEAPARQKAKP